MRFKTRKLSGNKPFRALRYNYRMDLSILYSIQDTCAHPALDAFFTYFTLLGNAGALWILIGLCMLLSPKWRFWGMCVLAALACVGLINELGIKNLVERVRPYIEHGIATPHIFPPTSYSFPSGHTGCSFAAATVLALAPIKKHWKALAWIVALLISFSRLYLFVHYPTDVLVGAVLGTLYGYLVVKAGLALRARRSGSAAHGKHAAI